MPHFEATIEAVGKKTDEGLAVSITGEQADQYKPGEKQLARVKFVYDEFFDMKGTSRKEYESEYYKGVCSEIIDDLLYLGSDYVA